VVIFSNQNGVESGKTSTKDLQEKLNAILDVVGLRKTVSVFMATDKDAFRKPGLRMWHMYESLFMKGATLTPESFYCGDAAGSKVVVLFLSF
jgi:DNA 3'-phosphatase